MARLHFGTVALMIVWIASYPRSGNTFCRVVLSSLFGFTTGAVYEEHPPEDLARILGNPQANSQPVADGPGLHFIKTHEMPLEDDHPAIYIVRDGRDALVSYARFILTFEARRPTVQHDEFRDTLRALVEEDGSFGGWGANVSSWCKRPRTAVIRFERLIGDPLGELNGALRDLGIEARPLQRVVPTFDELHAMLPAFFTTGQTGYWPWEMPVAIEEVFWRRYGGVMQDLGYQRQPNQWADAPRSASAGHEQEVADSGVYADGWVSQQASVGVDQNSPRACLAVRGMVPTISDPSFQTELRVLLDGRQVAERTLGPGDFDITAPLPEGVGHRRVELQFSRLQDLPWPDGRQAAALLHFVGQADFEPQ